MSLVEVLVAVLIGLFCVLGVGLLQESLVHRRAASDSISAATTLAELELERLLSLPTPETSPELTAGIHGPNSCVTPPCKVDETGATTVNGPYLVAWTVVDNDSSSAKPLVDASRSTKRITMNVTHVSNAHARATLVTTYKFK